MNATWTIVAFAAGFALGIALTLFAKRKASEDTVNAMKIKFEEVAKQASQNIVAIAKSELGAERGVMRTELEGKKDLIGQEINRIGATLEKMTKTVGDLEKDRENKFGELTSALGNNNDGTSKLLKTTQALQHALASTKTRGQWGERMAEDVLRLAGFIENVNYLKQKVIEGGSKPDITFLLPKNLQLNMDVKFPYENYIAYLKAESVSDKDRFKTDFLRDVRQRLNEVTSRDYINTQTVDYVVLFVPNEQIYAFIHEQEPSILDTGIRKKVVMCSPITLFAVLAIIRQAVDNFSLEKTSNEIIGLIGSFKKQWGSFVDVLVKIQTNFGRAQTEFDKLLTTRKTALERPLNKIEEIRMQKGITIQEPQDIVETPSSTRDILQDEESV